MASTSATKSSSLPSLHFKSPESQGYYYWLEPRLLKTITALCTDRTPFDSVSEYLPQLDVLLIRNTVLEQRRLAASLWNVYSELIHSVHKETKVNLDNFMHAISASLQGEYEPSLVNNSLNSVVELSETVGFSFTLICPSLNLLLLNNQNIPKFLLWKTLKRLNDALPNGASLLHENFTDICSKLLEYFDEKEEKSFEASEALELAELISSLIRSFSPILQVSVLLKLQHKVCLAVLSPSPWIGAIKLLIALLENNNEGVPLPIQVASTIFSREYNSENTEFKQLIIKGRLLCQIYKRPRRPFLGGFEEKELSNSSVV